MACVRCGAEKGHFYDCPESGFAAATAPVVTASITDGIDDSQQTFERARLLALPVVLGVMMAVCFTGFGHMLVRIVFGMWLHELGHASASWFTGGFAIPLPWFTRVNDRSALFTLVMFGGLGAWTRWLRERESRTWFVPVALMVLLVIGLMLPLRNREALILFMGDGGALVFGTLLMATVFLPDGARLSHGGLRWGFLVIGAGGFSDIAVQWIAARRDWAEIPFGRNEGAGLSDATRLVDQLGWSEQRLVNSYLVMSAVCFAALSIGWVVALLRARKS